MSHYDTNNVQIIPLSRISLAELLGVYDDGESSDFYDELELESGALSSHHSHSSLSQGNHITSADKTTNSANGASSSAQIIGLDTLRAKQDKDLRALAIGKASASTKKNNKSGAKNDKQAHNNKKLTTRYQTKVNQPSLGRLWTSCLCNIRSKTIWTLLVSLIVLMITFAGILVIVYSVAFNRLGGLMAENSVLRIMTNVYNDFDRIMDKQSSYANWDLLYEMFAPGGYSDAALDEFISYYYFPEYIKLSHKVNYVGFYFLNGTFTKGVGYDLDTLDPLEWPEEFASLPPGHALNQGMYDIMNRNGGFIRLSTDKVLLVSTVPIHFYGISSGILLYARILDNSKVLEYAQNSQLCLTLFTQEEMQQSRLKNIASKANKVDPIVLRTNDSSCIHCDPFYRRTWNLDDKFLLNNRECWDGEGRAKSRTVSYFINQDIFGQKSILLRFDEPLTLSLLGIKAFLFCYGVVCIVVILISIIVVVFFEFAVLRPITTLRKHLDHIVKNNDISRRISVMDLGEIGTMTQFLNGLLQSLNNSVKTTTEVNDQLHQTTHRAELEEKQWEVVMNKLNHFILFVNMSGAVVKANNAFYHRLGYAPSSTQSGGIMIDSVLEHGNVMQKLEEISTVGSEKDSAVLETRIKEAVTDVQSLAVKITAKKVNVMTSKNESSLAYLLVAIDMEENVKRCETLAKLKQTLESLKQQ